MRNCLKLAVIVSSFACDVQTSSLLHSLATDADSEFYTLYIQMESHTKLLTSSLEMKESIHEANLQLQDKVNYLNK